MSLPPTKRDRMAYEPLHHKYRPQTFAQLVGQEAIAATLTSALRQSRIAPAYLFCGPRGTGKTSSARILSKSLNCVSGEQPTPDPCGTCDICTSIVKGAALDVIEIDAASNTGVDNIRELIERAQFAPVQCRYKVYIIDEVHMLSTAAFNALLKTLEEPPDRVVFVLATTDPQRVLPTIISRCQRFDFRRIPLGSMVAHLQTIAQRESIAIEPEAIALVAQISQGGLRDAESLLDQLSLNDGSITAETVWELVGAVPERELLILAGAIADDDGVAVLDRARHLMDRGREPLIVLQNLASFFRDLLVAKTAPARRDLVAVTDETWQGMTALVRTLPLTGILHAQQRLRESEVQVKSTSQPRLWLEITLLGLLPSSLALGAAAGDEAAPTAIEPIAHKVPPVSSTPQAGAPQAGPQASSTPQAIPQPSTPQPDVALAGTPRPPAPAPPARAAEAPRDFPEEAAASQPVPLAASLPDSGPAQPTDSPANQPAVQATHSAAPAVPTVDLAQTWKDVLQHLRPPGIQALLQQHGRLLRFEGGAARVGIVSSPLMKIAEQRAKNVELAFEKALNAQVNVTFQVTGQTAETPAQPVSASAKVSVPSPPPAPRLPAPAPPPDSSAPPLPPESTFNNPGALPVAAAPEPPPLPPLDEDSALQAAKSFASMFNGQIVEWTEELDFLPTPDSANASAAPPLSGERGEPDIDVPF